MAKTFHGFALLKWNGCGQEGFLAKRIGMKVEMENSSTDWGAVLWLIIDVVAVVALGIAIVYSAWMWRHRRKTPAQCLLLSKQFERTTNGKTRAMQLCTVLDAQ